MEDTSGGFSCFFVRVASSGLNSFSFSYRRSNICARCVGGQVAVLAGKPHCGEQQCARTQTKRQAPPTQRPAHAPPRMWGPPRHPWCLLAKRGPSLPPCQPLRTCTSERDDKSWSAGNEAPAVQVVMSSREVCARFLRPAKAADTICAYREGRFRPAVRQSDVQQGTHSVSDSVLWPRRWHWSGSGGRRRGRGGGLGCHGDG